MPLRWVNGGRILKADQEIYKRFHRIINDKQNHEDAWQLLRTCCLEQNGIKVFQIRELP